MKTKRVLTGIKPTGTPHIGNYFGAIEPSIKMQAQYEPFYFIANLHALNLIPQPQELHLNTYKIAAVYLSLGLDLNRVVFWRQSDIPEVVELMWYLAPFAPFGLLSRAHSYKDAKGKGIDVNMGLFNYPLLMAADILLFESELVPVGKDQKQHVEIARDIAVRFNNSYGDILTLPEAIISEETALVPGIDGRKMSKSYNNVIPIFEDPKKLRKVVMQVITDSKTLDDPKDPNTCCIFQLYKLVADAPAIEVLRGKYLAGGYGYGHAKLDLFESLELTFSAARINYFKLMEDQGFLENVLMEGAKKARQRCGTLIDRVRSVVGVKF